jgi:hypothetical protein
MVDRDTGKYLAPNVYFHKRFIADRGHIQSFVLQIQVWEDDEWHSVIRCDSSHGQAHIDEIDPEGRTFSKTWLGVYPPYDDIYNAVNSDFSITWRKHVTRWKAQQGQQS